MSPLKQIKLKQVRDAIKAYARKEGISFKEAADYLYNSPNPYLAMVKNEKK